MAPPEHFTFSFPKWRRAPGRAVDHRQSTWADRLRRACAQGAWGGRFKYKRCRCACVAAGSGRHLPGRAGGEETSPAKLGFRCMCVKGVPTTENQPEIWAQKEA